jgi:hypothetical protein
VAKPGDKDQTETELKGILSSVSEINDDWICERFRIEKSDRSGHSVETIGSVGRNSRLSTRTGSLPVAIAVAA